MKKSNFAGAAPLSVHTERAIIDCYNWIAGIQEWRQDCPHTPRSRAAGAAVAKPGAKAFSLRRLSLC